MSPEDVARLREAIAFAVPRCGGIYSELRFLSVRADQLSEFLDVAEERDRLRARVEVLERALLPFAQHAPRYEQGSLNGYAEPHDDLTELNEPGLTVAHIRRAAEALAAGEKPDAG